MHFCLLLGFDYLVKNETVLKFSERSSSLRTISTSQKSTMAGSSSSSSKYVALERTMFTPVDDLEVLCEMLVDFRSLTENGFDFYNVIRFQGWEK